MHHENSLAPHFCRTILPSTAVVDCTQRLPMCSHLGTGTGVMPRGPSNPSFQLWLEILRMLGQEKEESFFSWCSWGTTSSLQVEVTTEGAQHARVPMSVGTILALVAPASTNCCQHLHLDQPPKLQAFGAPSFWSLTVCGHKRVFSS